MLGMQALRVRAPARASGVLAKRYIHPYSISPRRAGPGGRSSLTGNTVTVFGATGMLGRYIVNRLGREGNTVVVAFRGDDYCVRHLRQMGDVGQMTFQRINVNVEESLRAAVQHSNVVYNLMGKNIDTNSYSLGAMHTVVPGTIARLCREHGVEQFIHTSALGADKTSRSRYMRAKALGEEAVREEFPGATIIRPADMFGDEDWYSKRYSRMLDLPVTGCPVMDEGYQLKRPVYVADVALAMCNVLRDHRLAGKTYELAGPREYLLRDFIKVVADVTHRDTRLFNVPTGLYEWLSSILELAPSHWPYFSKDEAIREGLDCVPGGELPGMADLGVEPRYFEEISLNWLRMARKAMYNDEPLPDNVRQEGAIAAANLPDMKRGIPREY